MLIGKLVGRIWSTRKEDSINGMKLMVAELIGDKREGERIVVVDKLSAGVGDRVIIATGSAARRVFEDDMLPIDAAVIGIIDEESGIV